MPKNKDTTAKGALSAIGIAKSIQHTKSTVKNSVVQAWVKNLEKTIAIAYQSFEDEARKKQGTSQAAQWVLDNYYIIEQAISLFTENMPTSFFKRLPAARLNDGPSLPQIGRAHV